MRKWMMALAAGVASPALAVTAILPTTCRPDGSQCTTATPVTNPDGTPIGSSSSTNPSYSTSVAQSYPLLNNGTATPATNVSGGGYLYELAGGTFNGASEALQITNNATGAYVTYGSCSAACSINIPAIGQGSSVRVLETGGPSSGLNAKLEGLGGPAILPPYATNEQGAGYAASGKAAVPFSLTAAGASASFTPIAGRSFYLFIPAGTGAATCYMEAQGDGTNYAPETYGATLLRPINYTGAPILESLTTSMVGIPWRLDCGAQLGSFTSGTIAGRIIQP